MKEICAYAPATIANLSVGFDVLGIALDSIGDKVSLILNGNKNNRVTEIINGYNLPKDIEKNCCSVVIQKMQQKLNIYNGVDIRIRKGFKSGSGLGSSSASSAAAAYAYNELIGKPFTEQELVYFAAEGEFVACGTAHADNVAPSIMGGLVLIRSHNPVDIIKLPIPKNLHA
ncbi:MAG: homoserine kinase, partial [Saprospiraceae bacterium]|nr:homoserine kinase [Saprospiraceae bacterium]